MTLKGSFFAILYREAEKASLFICTEFHLGVEISLLFKQAVIEKSVLNRYN